MVIVVVPLVLPDTDTDAGLNVAEPPFGRPVADSVTVPVNPAGAMVIVIDFDVPFDMLKLGGFALNVKFPTGGGGALTTSVTGVECASVPLVPVIVNE